jgi:anti-anti-sigma factor
MPNAVGVSLRDAPPFTVIDLQGEVTMLAEGPIGDAYREASQQDAANVLLNFAGVDYLNSGGVAIIISILTQARKANRRIFVAGLTRHYRRIFDMMGLSRYASVFDTESAAREAFGAA